MSKILQVAQLGQEILRKKAKKVSDVHSPDIQELIANLIATVNDANGMGIAAPQVYEDKRLFIVASHPNVRYPNAPEMKPTAIINPEIIAHSEEVEKGWEGCLSIPGIRALVPRFKEIKVEYTTKSGKRVTKTFTDFLARIFQHEYDHIEGIVFLDRLESTKDIVTDKEYQRLISQPVTNQSSK